MKKGEAESSKVLVRGEWFHDIRVLNPKEHIQGTLWTDSRNPAHEDYEPPWELCLPESPAIRSPSQPEPPQGPSMQARQEALPPPPSCKRELPKARS